MHADTSQDCSLTIQTWVRSSHRVSHRTQMSKMSVVSAATGVPTAAGMSAARETRCVLSTRCMTGVPYMTLTVARLVALKVVERLGSAVWKRSMISVVRIKAIVNMPVEAMWPVKPWAGPKKNSPIEPVWAVISIRGAIVRSGVVVPVRTNRWPAANGNPNLWCRSRMQCASKRNRKSRKCKRGVSQRFPACHMNSPSCFEIRPKRNEASCQRSPYSFAFSREYDRLVMHLLSHDLHSTAIRVFHPLAPASLERQSRLQVPR